VRSALAAVATSSTPAPWLRAASLAAAAADRAVRAGYGADKAAAVDGIPWRARWVAALKVQADLLREVFGDPFRPAAVDPVWRRWNGGCVRKLAQGIYENRAFDELPILADAVEEAGCHHAGLLAHLRSPGPHVLGCCALDVVLGKG
jgi:hypothetical protein